MKKIALIFTLILMVCTSAAARRAVKTTLDKPDLAAIQAASTDENSKFYYPTLLKKFMANDTVMNDEDFQYFYYGTLFQEDYDPYRQQGNPETMATLAHSVQQEAVVEGRAQADSRLCHGDPCR